MLRVVCTPVPGLRFAPAELPCPVAEVRERLRDQPERCQWVFPTSRLRRAALRGWLRDQPRRAALLPGLHTLESFVGWALEHCLSQRPSVDSPERLFRISQAWHDATGSPVGPGFLAQLDRFVRDWQACGLTPKRNARDPFERTVESYLRRLEQDQRCDRMSQIVALTTELADPASWPNRVLLGEEALVLFDGFHRLEPVELQLMATLGKRCCVLLWLVGTPGQRSSSVVEQNLEALRGSDPHIESFNVADSPSPLAGLGRRLFPHAASRLELTASPAGLFVLKPPDAVAELEAVATQIKADYRESAATPRPLRLSDVAVVVPGPAYDPLVREVFPRHGLEFNLAGQALRLASSRPARLLLTALDMIRGHWRHDLLLDFLQHPLVLRKLLRADRLHDLIAARPRARQRFQFATWSETWQRQLDILSERIQRWETGTAALPDELTLDREEFLASQRDKRDALEELVTSLRSLLQPVAAMDHLLSQADAKEPLRDLVTQCFALLGAVEIDHWLTPLSAADHADGPAVTWVEFEKDQQAYSKLLDLLDGLSRQPAERLPRTGAGRPDPLAALLLALESESYQIKTEDDAGVQLFELREIRGLRFRHVYMLGLVDGQLPAVPEEGVLGSRRRQVEALRIQLEQKEEEAQHLFAQVFEAAEEKLVLSQPLAARDQRTLSSPFLSAVLERVAVPELSPPQLVCHVAGAAREIGQRARQVDRQQSWPTSTDCERHPRLGSIRSDLQAWQGRPGWPAAIRVDGPALLRTLFPDQRPFSTSDLETYAACPFRYFGSRVLRLSEREADDRKLLYGSLVHRVFQRFYDELRRLLRLEPDKPLPAIGAEHDPRLREIFAQEWQAFDQRHASPELAPLFGHERGVLRLFFEVMEQLEQMQGNLLNELVLGDGAGGGIVIGKDRSGRPVAVSGKIDRVDVLRDDPKQAVIADYKTGKPMELNKLRAKLADGRLLQLPLYAATLEIAQRELRVVGGAYLHVSERAYAKERGANEMLIPVGDLAPGKKSDSQPVLDTAAALEKALEFAGRIREGRFPLSPHTSGSTCECTSYCSFRHACRQPEGYQAD